MGNSLRIDHIGWYASGDRCPFVQLNDAVGWCWQLPDSRCGAGLVGFFARRTIIRRYAAQHEGTLPAADPKKPRLWVHIIGITLFFLGTACLVVGTLGIVLFHWFYETLGPMTSDQFIFTITAGGAAIDENSVASMHNGLYLPLIIVILVLALILLAPRGEH